MWKMLQIKCRVVTKDKLVQRKLPYKQIIENAWNNVGCMKAPHQGRKLPKWYSLMRLNQVYPLNKIHCEVNKLEIDDHTFTDDLKNLALNDYPSSPWLGAWTPILKGIKKVDLWNFIWKSIHRKIHASTKEGPNS